ncbi:hypothetical protein TCAL_04405 [Tigriopus californicus]|uniref:Uncharacterized protein n=2 Tax=Tigriopus californicus TaxID=6832 RepID=A0A553N867_TIGCA|nr:hypothetical protein TCAL_04405 [Tigriopus californicus]
MKLIEKGLYTCHEELVLLFLALTRTLKWPSRLVLNLTPVGMKPETTFKGIKREKVEDEEDKECNLDKAEKAQPTQSKAKRIKVENTEKDLEQDLETAKKVKSPKPQGKGIKVRDAAESDKNSKSRIVAQSKKAQQKDGVKSKSRSKLAATKETIANEDVSSKTHSKGKAVKPGDSKIALSNSKAPKSESLKDRAQSKPRIAEQSPEKNPAKKSKNSSETPPKRKNKEKKEEKSRSRNNNNSDDNMSANLKRKALRDRNDEKSKTKSRSSSRSDTKIDPRSSRHQSRSSTKRSQPSIASPQTKKTSDRSSSRRSSRSIKQYRERSETEDESDEEPKCTKTQKSKSNASKLPSKLSNKAKEEAKSRQSRKPTSFQIKSEGSDSESDFSSMTQRPKKKARPTLPAPPTTTKKTSAKGGSSKLAKFQPVNMWLEVLIDSKWECVDVIRKKIGCTMDMEERCSKPMAYVLACDPRGRLKDVTKKYAKEFMTKNRKLRIDETWLKQTLRPWAPPKDALDDLEDQQIDQALQSMPIPTTVSAFKDHPLYALPRHLLKYEAIYPPNPMPLGYLKGEPIYARECVHHLNGRTNWLKEGRVVRIGEESYKVVKGGPKWDKMTSSVVKGPPLELFGKWQTEVYVPPPAVDGKVPRNEYGNVELFQPWMLPKGTVHIPIKGISRLAYKLKIDCAPAMMGWDSTCGWPKPILDGFIVCEEYQDILLDAWNTEEEEKLKRAEEKREKRVLDNWRKLVKGMLIVQRIKLKYV